MVLLRLISALVLFCAIYYYEYSSKNRTSALLGSGAAELKQENHTLIAICIPRTLCPDEPWYRPSCQQNATGPPFLPSVPHDFVHDLYRLFHHKRVALVGDSLTRQWFETLSCRLGMKRRFYETSEEPERIRQALNMGVPIDPLHVPPSNMKTAHGYARASVPTMKGGNKFDCEPLVSTLEYYHMDRNNHSSPKILEFVANHSDILVVNIGLHYPGKDKLEPDLRDTMEQCGALENCYFRETFPQHFSHVNKTRYSGEYKGNGIRHDRCGPIVGHHYGNANVNKFGHLFQVPIVRVEDKLRGAWKWHLWKGGNSHQMMDCTHYCQDNRVWDLVHSSLLEAALNTR